MKVCRTIRCHIPEDSILHWYSGIAVFYDVTPCDVVNMCQRFEGTGCIFSAKYLEDGGNRRLVKCW
jgi:hypothetical protein